MTTFSPVRAKSRGSIWTILIDPNGDRSCIWFARSTASLTCWRRQDQQLGGPRRTEPRREQTATAGPFEEAGKASHCRQPPMVLSVCRIQHVLERLETRAQYAARFGPNVCVGIFTRGQAVASPPASVDDLAMAAVVLAPCAQRPAVSSPMHLSAPPGQLSMLLRFCLPACSVAMYSRAIHAASGAWLPCKRGSTRL